MTNRQKQVLDFIGAFVNAKGYSPSYAEVGAALGLHSLATVCKHIKNLERQGKLSRTHKGGRSLVVDDRKRSCVQCSRLEYDLKLLSGAVQALLDAAAGRTLTAEQHGVMERYRA